MVLGINPVPYFWLLREVIDWATDSQKDLKNSKNSQKKLKN